MVIEKGLQKENEADGPVSGTNAEIFGKFVGKPIREHGIQAFPKALQAYMKALKIEPDYLQKAQPEFAEMRRRLNTESGIMMMNHPGLFDIYLVFATIERTDFKVMAQPNAYEFFCALLGEDRVLVVKTDPVGLKVQARAIKDHISKGGLLLLQPTGGDDAVYNPASAEGIKFKDGTRFIIKRVLAPTDMVYSFYINPEDIVKAGRERISPETSGLEVRDKDRIISTVGIVESAPIQVDERYSTAEEWQKLVQNDKAVANEVLAQHFVDQFKN